MKIAALDNLFFRTAVHQCDDFVIVTDADANVLYVNPAFEKHTGFKLKEIKDKNISLIKSGLHNKTFYKKLWTELKKGNSISKVFINKNKKGDIYYENKTITPIKNSVGKIEYYLSTSKDFTKEVQLRQEVISQNKFIQGVIKSTDALIIGLDKSSNIVLFNGACEKLTGYKAKEVLGKNIFDVLIPKKDIAKIKRVFNDIVLRKNKVVKHENVWQTKSNSEYLISWSNTILSDGVDDFFILATGINITKERENENKLLELNASLDQKVKQRTAEVENLNSGISIKNELLKKINSSLPALVYLFNVKSKKLKLINNKINSAVDFPVNIDVELDFKTFASYLQPSKHVKLTAKLFFNENSNQEYIYSVNKETYFLQHKPVVFESDAKGNPLVYLGTLTDVTKLKVIQQNYEQSQAIAHIGTWDWDIETGALDWSDEIYRIFELDPKIFTPSYTTFLEIIHQEDRPLLERTLAYAIENKLEYELIHRLETKPGKIKYVIEQGVCYYDEDGKPIRMIGTVRDITDSEYTKKRLEESQELTKTGSWEYNLITGKFIATKQLYAIWDLNPLVDSISMEFITERITPRYFQLVMDSREKAIKNKTKEIVEYEITTAKNITKHVRRTVFAEYDSKGNAIKLFGSVQDITDEWEQKNKLLNYFSTLENSLSAIFTSDFTGKILYANKMAVNMWGYENMDEMIKEREFAENYWCADEFEKVTDCLKETVNKGYCVSKEPYKALRKNGEVGFIKFSLTLIKDVAGTPVLMTGSFIDVTEEYKIKKEIEEADKKLKALLSNINEIVYGIEVNSDAVIDGKLFFVSAKVKELLGYDDNAFKNDSGLWHSLLHPDDVQTIYDTTINAIETKTEVVRTYRMKHGITGEYRWFEDKFSPAFDANGNIKSFYGSASDITERMLYQVKLQESEAKYRSIYENALVGIFRTNYETKEIIDGNDVCVKMFGHDTREEMFKYINSEDYFVNKEDRRRMIMSAKINNGIISNQEVLFKKKDGTPFWVSVNARLNRETGTVDGMFVDITERKKYEEVLKQNINEKDILLKEIHHRVKNNLQVISSLLKLQLHKSNNPILKETISDSVARIRAIALLHEKMYLGDDISVINFSEYLENLTRSVYPIYKDKVVKLEFHLDDYYSDINEAMPLGLACYEIVSNAFKHAFNMLKHGELIIQIQRKKGSTKIEISDNGSGFDIQHIDITKTLGWNLINNLIKQAKGNLEVITEINKGSKFIITL